MGQEDIEKLLQKFRSVGYLNEQPLYSLDQLNGIEKEVNSKFPQDFKSFITAGNPDRANFEFQLPHRWSFDNEYIIFARWNDELFAFKAKEGSPMSKVIYIMEEDTKPEVAFNDFIGYIQAIFIAEKTKNNPQ